MDILDSSVQSISLVYKGEIQIICIKFTRINEPLFCFLDVTKKKEGGGGSNGLF